MYDALRRPRRAPYPAGATPLAGCRAYPDTLRLFAGTRTLHDFDLEHEHYFADATERDLATGELVQLITVGIDIGSATSHLMFSRLHLKRLGEGLSSRYVVVLRATLHRSPILLTPYTSDHRIDALALGKFVAESYAGAGLAPDEVDSGAIILTGEAVKRENARSLAEHLAGESGKFVCATAGHNLESVLAAHGSGAVALSRRERCAVLNIDIGGGTTKLALVSNGEVLETAAINVGGRLVALDRKQCLVRIEPAARRAAEQLGLRLELGKKLARRDLTRLAATLAAALLEAVRRPPRNLSQFACDLMLTPPFALDRSIDRVTFSGGVSEYVYRRERRDFGDLAKALARAINAQRDALPAPVEESPECIRATVIGASQFTVQVSGSTNTLSRLELLPLRNLPVLRPRLSTREDTPPEVLAEAIGRAHTRLDLAPGEQPVALALDWDGTPRYESLHRLASGIARGFSASLAAGLPLILVFKHDFGKLVGSLLIEDFGVRDIVSIDGIELAEFDFIDIGELIKPAHVVPVVVKSLVFPAAGGAQGEILEN